MKIQFKWNIIWLSVDFEVLTANSKLKKKTEYFAQVTPQSTILIYWNKRKTHKIIVNSFLKIELVGNFTESSEYCWNLFFSETIKDWKYMKTS